MSNTEIEKNIISNDRTISNTDIDELSDCLIHEPNDTHEITNPSGSPIIDIRNDELNNAHYHDTNERHDIDNKTTIRVIPSDSTITDTDNDEFSDFHNHNTNNMQDNETNFEMNGDTPEDLVLENFMFSNQLSRSVVRCLSPIDPCSLSRSVVVEGSHIESRGNVMLY